MLGLAFALPTPIGLSLHARFPPGEETLGLEVMILSASMCSHYSRFPVGPVEAFLYLLLLSVLLQIRGCLPTMASLSANSLKRENLRWTPGGVHSLVRFRLRRQLPESQLMFCPFTSDVNISHLMVSTIQQKRGKKEFYQILERSFGSL